VNPDADVTEGFPAGTMPNTFKDDLSEQEINQLVKYLMTLK
jgi:mono/diheme cytochrome c family protein